MTETTYNARIWNAVTSDTLMEPEKCYVLIGNELVTLTLPLEPKQGDTIDIISANNKGFKIAQNPRQSILFTDSFLFPTFKDIAKTIIGINGFLLMPNKGSQMRLLYVDKAWKKNEHGKKTLLGKNLFCATDIIGEITFGRVKTIFMEDGEYIFTMVDEKEHGAKDERQ